MFVRPSWVDDSLSIQGIAEFQLWYSLGHNHRKKKKKRKNERKVKGGTTWRVHRWRQRSHQQRLPAVLPRSPVFRAILSEEWLVIAGIRNCYGWFGRPTDGYWKAHHRRYQRRRSRLIQWWRLVVCQQRGQERRIPALPRLTGQTFGQAWTRTGPMTTIQLATCHSGTWQDQTAVIIGIVTTHSMAMVPGWIWKLETIGLYYSSSSRCSPFLVTFWWSLVSIRSALCKQLPITSSSVWL